MSGSPVMAEPVGLVFFYKAVWSVCIMQRTAGYSFLRLFFFLGGHLAGVLVRAGRHL